MSPNRLPAVIHRKLARCQCQSGRICPISHRNSADSRNGRDTRGCVTEGNLWLPEYQQDPVTDFEARIVAVVLSRKSDLCTKIDQ